MYTLVNSDAWRRLHNYYVYRQLAWQNVSTLILMIKLEIQIQGTVFPNSIESILGKKKYYYYYNYNYIIILLRQKLSTTYSLYFMQEIWRIHSKNFPHWHTAQFQIVHAYYRHSINHAGIAVWYILNCYVYTTKSIDLHRQFVYMTANQSCTEVEIVNKAKSVNAYIPLCTQ